MLNIKNYEHIIVSVPNKVSLYKMYPDRTRGLIINQIRTFNNIYAYYIT